MGDAKRRRAAGFMPNKDLVQIQKTRAQKRAEKYVAPKGFLPCLGREAAKRGFDTIQFTLINLAEGAGINRLNDGWMEMQFIALSFGFAPYMTINGSVAVTIEVPPTVHQNKDPKMVGEEILERLFNQSDLLVGYNRAYRASTGEYVVPFVLEANKDARI